VRCRTKQDFRVTTAGKEAQEGETGRIVLFPSRISLGKARRRGGATSKAEMDMEVGDLRQYERSGEPEDYSRRMIVNAIAFAFIVMLTLAGIWLAETLALLRKNQDCAFSGRRNCTPIDIHTTDR
jgi:hypothetical protein